MLIHNTSCDARCYIAWISLRTVADVFLQNYNNSYFMNDVLPMYVACLMPLCLISIYLLLYKASIFIKLLSLIMFSIFIKLLSLIMFSILKYAPVLCLANLYLALCTTLSG